MTPHRCPVCDGVGMKPPGFYDLLPCSTTSASPEQCRTCYGRGIVWEPGLSEQMATDPGFLKACEQGLKDIEAGRVSLAEDVERRLLGQGTE